ncbi:hypothetical protein PF005_g10787 [Phytophthora fragariae]|uniref:Uncharacterized protein n=1 Tax=Phytophthora fragariae TaxID=53985 RepID=A0A6A3EXB6_9STRA|nr:hypothetical protein PF009_g11943 [Phytophthora fragariae]KAE9011174.1 hypothetical protein PF011_g9484 [Phytophthora fragariae]KAE9113339.1 hypothetical protein PF010_g10115 [Phytophthora fragariae]KAE9119086.1 hypothetical protein PF007_g8683 [Phytophthora fragariae]KAE9145022.1 hypothetical protein PF006_g10088 [Phytophthora fragariae]
MFELSTSKDEFVSAYTNKLEVGADTTADFDRNGSASAAGLSASSAARVTASPTVSPPNDSATYYVLSSL